MEARVFEKKTMPSRHRTDGRGHAFQSFMRTLSMRLDDATLAARKKEWPATATSGAHWNHAADTTSHAAI
jgi:hypothetical protein